MKLERKLIIPRHLGRRGTSMILLALLWAWIGANVFLGNSEPHSGLLHTTWPTWVRVAEWWVAAAVALVYAWKLRDWPGWVALILPPILRAVSYIWGWVVYLAPDGNPGYERGLWSSVLYLFMVGICLTLSRWPDYPPRTRTERALDRRRESREDARLERGDPGGES